MTFNRTALDGVSAGLATALGAALTDGLLFFLSLVGFWGREQLGQKIILVFNLGGAIVLVFLGCYYWQVKPALSEETREQKTNIDFWLQVLKTFFVTAINPSAMLFFMFISLKLFSRFIGKMSIVNAALGGCALAAGTFLSLGLVTLIARFVGAKLSANSLRKLFQTTSFILFAAAILLLWDAFSQI
jgi:threonine/homoserine/homoserine lactone efflux protein